MSSQFWVPMVTQLALAWANLWIATFWAKLLRIGRLISFSHGILVSSLMWKFHSKIFPRSPCTRFLPAKFLPIWLDGLHVNSCSKSRMPREIKKWPSLAQILNKVYHIFYSTFWTDCIRRASLLECLWTSTRCCSPTIITWSEIWMPARRRLHRDRRAVQGTRSVLSTPRPEFCRLSNMLLETRSFSASSSTWPEAQTSWSKPGTIVDWSCLCYAVQLGSRPSYVKHT